MFKYLALLFLNPNRTKIIISDINHFCQIRCAFKKIFFFCKSQFGIKQPKYTFKKQKEVLDDQVSEIIDKTNIFVKESTWRYKSWCKREIPRKQNKKLFTTFLWKHTNLFFFWVKWGEMTNVVFFLSSYVCVALKLYIYKKLK